jgi:hypothetical protein
MNPQDAAPSKGLDPLPIGNDGRGEVSPSSSAPADPIDRWIEDNPETREFPAVTPQAEIAPKTDATPAQATTEQPKGEPVAKTDAPVAKTTEAPKAATPGTEAPKAAESTTQSTTTKPSYSPEDKIPLAEGVEWTRGQVVAALQERAQLQPMRGEVDTFKSIFRCSAEEAKQNWAPLMERLSKEPNTLGFIDEYLSNGAKAEYLEQCSTFFDQNAPQGQPTQARGQRQQQQQQQPDPVLAQQVRELQSWRAEQQRQNDQQRMRSDWSACVERYPMLATDQHLQADLKTTADALYFQAQAQGFPQGQNRPWFLDALALKASIYDALKLARTQQQQPAAAQVQIPALLGSPGASPNGTRSNGAAQRAKQYDDPVDRYLANPDPRFAS